MDGWMCDGGHAMMKGDEEVQAIDSERKQIEQTRVKGARERENRWVVV